MYYLEEVILPSLTYPVFKTEEKSSPLLLTHESPVSSPQKSSSPPKTEENHHPIKHKCPSTLPPQVNKTPSPTPKKNDKNKRKKEIPLFRGMKQRRFERIRNKPKTTIIDKTPMEIFYNERTDSSPPLKKSATLQSSSTHSVPRKDSESISETTTPGSLNNSDVVITHLENLR